MSVPTDLMMMMDDMVNATSTSFCSGTGQAMNMIGFTSVISQKRGTTPCVNIFFKEWTLDTAGKFGGACIGTLLVAIFVQYLSKVSSTLSEKRKRNISQSYILDAILISIVYILQITFSYFLMLLAMTYNAEIFALIIVGLYIGFMVFNFLPSTNAALPATDGIQLRESDTGTTSPYSAYNSALLGR